MDWGSKICSISTAKALVLGHLLCKELGASSWFLFSFSAQSKLKRTFKKEFRSQLLLRLPAFLPCHWSQLQYQLLESCQHHLLHLLLPKLSCPYIFSPISWSESANSIWLTHTWNATCETVNSLDLEQKDKRVIYFKANQMKSSCFYEWRTNSSLVEANGFRNSFQNLFVNTSVFTITGYQSCTKLTQVLVQRQDKSLPELSV